MMFEEFQSKTDKEWIDQANLETSRYESISFPYTFLLDGLPFNAINTADSVQSKKAVVFEDKRSQGYPVKSILFERYNVDSLNSEILHYGLQDIMVEYQNLSETTIPDSKVDISSLTSIGINFADFDWKEVHVLVENFAKYPDLSFTIFQGAAMSSRLDVDSKKFTELISFASKNGNKQFRALGFRSDYLGNWGASAIQELAASLSLLVFFWDRLSNENLSLPQLCNQTEVALSLSGEFYTDLTKFKAFRILLYYILDAYDSDDPNPYSIRLRAVSGTTNKTLYDPDGNLLRNTVEALAATVGGADVISLRPHDFRYQNSSLFGQRMAANVQNLLEYESHLNAVQNPSDGSYFFEKAINSMVEKTWELFLRIEESGGYYTSDLVDRAIFEENIKSKEKDLLQQKHTVVGVTRYANPLEKLETEQINLSQNRILAINKWEETRLSIGQLSGKKVLTVAILKENESTNSSVTSKITFVSNLLTTIGMSISTIGERIDEVLESPTPDLLFFCGSNEWCIAELEKVTSQNELKKAGKIVVGDAPIFLELEKKNRVDAIIHEQADLTPFFKTINTLIS